MGVQGGWQITAIYVAQTGEYLTPSFSGSDPSNTNTLGGIPDRIGNGNLPSSQRTIDRWFDLAAFETPSQFSFGNSGRGILIGPGTFNVDLGIQREFPLDDFRRFQFRWEMFNMPNHVNYSSPTTDIGLATTGKIYSAGGARSMQLGLKFIF